MLRGLRAPRDEPKQALFILFGQKLQSVPFRGHATLIASSLSHRTGLQLLPSKGSMAIINNTKTVFVFLVLRNETQLCEYSINSRQNVLVHGNVRAMSVRHAAGMLSGPPSY